MTDKTYFFDSYAVIETIKGNPNYIVYKKCGVVLTKLVLFEVYFKLIKEFTEADANKFLAESYNLAADFGSDVIKYAAKFRLDNMNKNLSMTDCVGYVLSKNLGIKFLTGDEQFKSMENVEFAK
ncbi:MAG: PIN domain-containing protein [Candidatus Aenigmarchaeota archaeon]|nr:PIN domain-containing protein [Candidatus Aenigmarchaeota archaeon]